MAIPTTATFKLTFDELLDAAQARLGGEQMSGYTARSAKRAFQVMLAHWANIGIQMWTITEFTATIPADQNFYVMPSDCVDVNDISLITNETDPLTTSVLTRIGRGSYQDISNKASSGSPNQYFVDRQQSSVTTYLFPVATTEYKITGWYQRRLKDVVDFTDDLDIPFRYTEASIAGLAYYLSKENKTTIPFEVRKELEIDYKTSLSEAQDGDADNSNLSITPDLSMYM